MMRYDARSLNLLWELTVSQYKLKDQSTFFGFLWSLLNPLFMVGVLFIFDRSPELGMEEDEEDANHEERVEKAPQEAEEGALVLELVLRDRQLPQQVEAPGIVPHHRVRSCGAAGMHWRAETRGHESGWARTGHPRLGAAIMPKRPDGVTGPPRSPGAPRVGKPSNARPVPQGEKVPTGCWCRTTGAPQPRAATRPEPDTDRGRSRKPL